jgi:cytosine/adenosine deaminase-related metal-dependent hydrolase
MHDAGVLIEDGRIEAVGPFQVLSTTYPRAPVVDCAGDVLLPGFIDAHSHGRAMPLDAQGIAAVSLEEFFLRIPAMTALDPCDDAFVAGSDLVATGITSAQVNFHTFADAESYADQAHGTIDGLRRSRIRPTLVACITEQSEFVPESWLESAPPNLQEMASLARRGIRSREYFEVVRTLRSGRPDRDANRDVDIALGPCSPQWCSDVTWAACGELMASGVRAQTHLLETSVQRSPAYGPAAVDKLLNAGAMSDQLSAAHGVWLTDDELATVAERGVSLVHCPSSNTRLMSGTARVRSWLDAGIRVAFGLDSNTVSDPPDVFAELRHAASVASQLGPVTSRELFGMATSGGAAACGKEDELGAIRPGFRADLVSVSLPEASKTGGDLLDSIFAVATRANVRAVWVDGRPAVREGRHLDAADVARARGRLRTRLDTDAGSRAKRIGDLADIERWAQLQFGQAAAETVEAPRQRETRVRWQRGTTGDILSTAV